MTAEVDNIGVGLVERLEQIGLAYGPTVAEFDALRIVGFANGFADITCFCIDFKARLVFRRCAEIKDRYPFWCVLQRRETDCLLL